MTRQTSFVLTNRMNLNTILSTRIVGPRALFTKYYPDPLEITGNAVALLGSPPDAAFVASVAATTRVGPVLLEIARPASDAVDLVPAVPFSKVVAVHMPSERVAREHLARRYANIHPHGELVQVSPDLFDGTCSEDDVRKAAAGASASAPFVPPVDWGHIDRLRGACGAAVRAAQTPDCLLFAAAMLRDLAVPAPDPATADGLVQRAALDVLCARDMQQSWDPAEIVDAVRDCCQSAELTRRDRRLMDLSFMALGAIQRAELPFLPFRARRPALPAVRALLLVLLRPSLSDLLSWPATETGADPNVRQRAAALAGILRGLAREDCGVRSVTVDDQTAAMVCSGAGEGEPRATELRETDGSFTLRIGQVLVACVGRTHLGAPA
jgi:hypothetical protein